MPEPTTPTAPVVAAGPATDLPADDPKGEGTTPEEVAQVLKSSGMDVTINKPKAANVDDEEGDDPDKPVEAETDEDVDEDEDKPEAKPKVTTPATDEATDDKYSFQVEDANGVTFKISAEANVEDVLSEFEPKNNGQIISILDQLRTVKDQKASDDAKAEQDATAEERRSRASELLTGWQDEAKALQGSKRIADGKDGETRINEVYKFMAEQNDTRMKAGKPTLNSFEDALDKLENKEGRDKLAAEAKAEKDKARENGAKVGGASAPASNSAPVYKAGTAKNANQALRGMGLLE